MTEYTPESYNKRVEEWQSVDEASLRTFPYRTPEERKLRRIGDAERTAITLLLDGDCNHRLLSVWIRRLAKDPAYAEYMPMVDTIPLSEWAEFLKAKGYGGQDETSTLTHMQRWRAEGYGSVMNGYVVELAYPAADDDGDLGYEKSLDAARLRLADALVSHRNQGEDGLDSASDLGFGMQITTSLAAAIAEYHRSVCNILVRGRKTTLPTRRHPGEDEGAVFIWENDNISLSIGRSHPSETALYVVNKHSEESLSVHSVKRPMYRF